MNRSKCGMVSPRSFIWLVAMLNLVAFTNAGPLGPLPVKNVTSADMGLKEGSCALGDVVYMPGDEFPGSSPCERCQCSQGGVHCAQQQCEPRPGCKALHRPDHCCPTYQCECEQEGRVYGNGEKLVDPQDPCRVCYCQGGEVVCRRIACFVRDDCSPRLVPGRCCPEYDNCPLRGVTTLPGMTSSLPAIPASSPETGIIPTAPKGIVKQEITIKEITPVSEIPIITDVKIKEILPSPSIEVAEYSPSKSPLIPREATSEKSINTDEAPKLEQEMPSVVEVHSSPEMVSTEESKTSTENKGAPSKISLSTQDSINSDIYPSPIVPSIATMESPTVTPDTRPVASTIKTPMLEEDDSSLFDHNPAFPPLPDDLSVLSNHGDEIVPEPSADSDHMPVEHVPVQEVTVASITTSTVVEAKEPLTTTAKYLPDTYIFTTEKSLEFSTIFGNIPEFMSTIAPVMKEIPTIKLRSAIPTEIFSSSSEEVTESEEKVSVTENNQYVATQTPTTSPTASTTIFSITTEAPIFSEKITKSGEVPKSKEITQAAVTSKSIEITNFEETTKSAKIVTEELVAPIERVSFLTTSTDPEPENQSTTQKIVEPYTTEASSSTSHDQTTSSISKSNVATEVTSQTELSSLPIETSDQNPHDSSASENVSKDSLEISTNDQLSDLSPTTEKPIASSEVITVPKTDSKAIENVETTEFILTSFGSSESSTDAVELIKIPGDSDKNAAIIDRAEGNKNALTDLIKLVNDVASMSDHTTSISDSEELIPVNAGYKSKNSNFNQNSITEVPFKSKSVPANKQKVVEIEDDESAGITDSLPPNDKVEPTTRRPIIDNVSDDMLETKSDKKDIEIITQSYVPTINRKPTKVILREKPDTLEELPQDDAPAPISSENEGVTSRDSIEYVTGSSVELSSGSAELTSLAPFIATEDANATLSEEQ